MILDRIFGLETRAAIKWSGSALSQDATAKRVWGVNTETVSGVSIDSNNCTALSAVYRAVVLLAGTVGHLPLMIYRRTSEDGDKETARDHPLFRVLHKRPNPELTSIRCRQLWMSFTLLWGHSYSYIERRSDGTTIGLWPMRTGDVGRRRVGGKLFYDIGNVRDNDLLPRPPTSVNTLNASDVLEFSTYDGESIVHHAREQLGEARAAQDFAGGFFGGGAQPYMVLKHPARLKDPDRLRKNWEAVHGGAKRRIGVLEEGMDISTVGMPLDDAQFLESRQFHVTEIARWFGIPPHKLMDLTRATFSNIEEQNLEWRESLLPWLEMMEQEMDCRLFTEAEQRDHYTEHNLDELLRASTVNRYQAHEIGQRVGLHSVNDLLRMEGKNGIGPEGDIRLVPANLVPLDQAKAFWESKDTKETSPGMQGGSDGGTPPEASKPVPGSEPAKIAARAALLSAVERMIVKEVAEVRDAAKRPDKFLEWLDRFYAGWGAKIHAGLAPAIQACRAIGLEPSEYATAVERHASVARQSLLDLSGRCKPNELAGRIDGEVQQWPVSIPARMTTTILGE